jgi:sorting nexin-9/18/33
MPAAGPAFYARVYHPAFNLDLEDAEDALHCFQTHTKAVGKGIQRLRTVFGRVRESRIGSFLSLHSSSSKNSCLTTEMSKAERLLSYSLLSLISSKPTLTPINEEDEHPNGNHNGKAKGLVNSYGAWCWREGCVG